MSISREDLYDLVWTEPMIKVAERFGVSGSYMARICTLMNVPRPVPGYWAKRAVGKAPTPIALPKPRPGDQLAWSRDGELAPPARPVRPPSRAKKRRVRIPRDRIHGLIRAARVHFENGRPVDEGAYLKPYKWLLVDVIASKACLGKALELANDVFNAFESVGHRVVIAPSGEQLVRPLIDERERRDSPRHHHYHRRLWSPCRPTVVYIGSVSVGLAVVEMSEDVLLRYVGGKYVRDAEYVARHRSRYALDHSGRPAGNFPRAACASSPTLLMEALTGRPIGKRRRRRPSGLASD